jgi:two-component sensor histidine kinase/PAS domain-containing protein
MTAAEAAAPAVTARGSDRPVRSASLRRRLWALVLALALPAIGLAAAGLYATYRAERDSIALRLRETTRALAFNLDRELEKTEVGLRVLALSPYLRTGDFAAFHRQALEAKLINPAWISLFEPNGRTVLSTRVPYGTVLPNSTRSETLARIKRTGLAEVSDLYVGSQTKEPLISVDVPVLIDGEVAFILSSAILPDVFQQLIADQRIAWGWNAAVLDKSGKIVARSRNPEMFVGQVVRPGLLEALRTSTEGDVESVTLDGVPVRTYFSKSPDYGWAFVIGLPESELSAIRRRPLGWFLALVGSVLAGLVAATLLSRSIAKPIDQLVASARALGRGEPVAASATVIHEFDVIQRALAEASADIGQYQREREKAYGDSLESEAKLRLALSAGELGSWEYTPATGAFSASATCRANFGRFPEEPFTYQDLVGSIHPEDRPKQAAAVANAVETGTDLHVEYRVIWPDDGVHWIRVSGRILTDSEGRLTMVGVSQDVTERKRADERQRLLLHELNHRVKNTLATVQSVASLTRRSVSNEGDPALWDAFTGRLQGLAKTNDLLTASNWDGAYIEDILRNELGPYQDGMEQRIKLRGSRVSLHPSAALALGLAVHELATNAAKYGALSLPDGRVSVMWGVTSGGGPLNLLIEWVERGGPIVSPPKRQGFGSKLIQRGLAQQLGGTIKVDYAPAGVRCVITFPVKAVVANLGELVQDDPDERAAS